MKTILAVFLTFLFFLPVSALGEIQTIAHTVKQPFGGSQSADDARISAIAKAKREALEMAGVYVEALTIVKDATVDKDEILALTAGVLKTEVVSQKNYVTGEGFGIEVVVKIIVDPSVLEGRVKKLLQDRTHLDQLNQARKKEKELLDKMAILEKENRLLMGKKESSKDLQKQFEGVSQGLTAVDWVDKALALWNPNNGKYTDTGKAIEYLSEAIRLNPNYADAYGAKGVAYSDLGQHQRAIQDFNEALRLKPDYAEGYYNRGIAYNALGQNQRAIKDYDEAIRIIPDFAEGYHNRAYAYYYLKQYSRAIQDLNEAIRLKPKDLAMSYYCRGSAYSDLGQHQRAIQDFNEAIRLKPDYANAWFNIGVAYVKLDRLNDAVEALRQAIRINPELAEAWFYYGLGSAMTGNRTAALDAVRELRRLDPARADELFNLIVPR